jgi:hypothetical protein
VLEKTIKVLYDGEPSLARFVESVQEQGHIAVSDLTFNGRPKQSLVVGWNVLHCGSQQGVEREPRRRCAQEIS